MFTIFYFQVKVEIVVQFFKVGEIDTLKEQYSADVIVKAKWREPSFDGQNTMVNKLSNEPGREKINNLGSDQVRQKLDCTDTQDG